MLQVSSIREDNWRWNIGGIVTHDDMEQMERLFTTSGIYVIKSVIPDDSENYVLCKEHTEA